MPGITKVALPPKNPFCMITYLTGKPGSLGMPKLEGLRVHCVFPLYNTSDWGPERKRDLFKIVLAEERPKPGFLLPGQGSFPELL